ncbi:hypothetical protein DF185_22805 [Marinifilum breve]|uniref:Peptidase S74 domain-containing protein n=1 Tax=Marinifilum breve TaxID=2184082 RepID=A0A2V3ZTK2_9BACT|nr:hypothetical protein [Marinifilum breve]PXX95011.1 hypothetical protein DF185_22805 [Marinifilum breve]
MKRICIFILFQIWSIYGFTQNNEYPSTGNVKIYNYSPKLILQRDTPNGGFIQGVQTKLFDGTDNWYFGAHQTYSWVVSKGNYQGIKFTVLENGNVGIGINEPNRKLDIKGGIKLRDSGVSSWDLGFGANSDPVRFLSIDVVNSALNTDPLELVYSRGSGVIIGRRDAADKYLKVYGNIEAKEMKIVTQIGADFVFEDNYQLRSLEEVEDFVKENKHLPDVATAKEMQENGVNQSEMNQKLLQKIEELTLYVIDQNKKTNKLITENEVLKKRIIQLEKRE